ncbi:MAG: Nramp family divalent metal transporter [Desulfuromonadia bacterium]
MRIRDVLAVPIHRHPTVSNVLKFIGPGLLVTVGFIDPGNWAANLAAGAGYGYTLLWMVTLSTLMLILLQHNAAHLGIVTGDCLSEAATRHFSPLFSRPLLASAALSASATVFAELLGAGIALNMLTSIPIPVGSTLTAILCVWLLLSKSYRKLEQLIIGFVSLIGFAFVIELLLVQTRWSQAAAGWVTPSIPPGSTLIVMSVLGAVVMPHNLFLHSEIIQSRQWHTEGEAVIVERLRYEFLDTIFSMLVGWGINSAMILVAAATFYLHGTPVDDLAQAYRMLTPLLGKGAAVVFALALLSAGIASSITAGMSGGSIIAGMHGEPYASDDPHTRRGIIVTMLGGAAPIWLVTDPFRGLIISQMLLSIQLPWTIFLQIRLTSSPRIMGSHANSPLDRTLLWVTFAIVTLLNLILLVDSLKG